MARSAQDLTSFRQAYNQYLGRDPEQGAVDAFNGSDIPINQRINQITTSPEYFNHINQQSQSLYQPQIDAANKQLGANLASNANNQQVTQNQINDNAGYAQQGLADRLSSAGFMRSGEQIGGGAIIARNQTTDLNRAAIQRSIADADATLQNTQFNTGAQQGIIQNNQNLQQRDLNLRQQGYDTNNVSFANQNAARQTNIAQQGQDLAQRQFITQGGQMGNGGLVDFIRSGLGASQDPNNPLIQQLLKQYGIGQ